MRGEKLSLRFAAWTALFILFLCAAEARAQQAQVFLRGADGSLTHFDGARWESRGGQIVGAPDACSWGTDRIDVVARGTDNTLRQIARVGGQWSGWYDLGGQLTSSPSCVSWGPNRIDVFARGADGTLIHKAFDGEGWSEWESLGGELPEGAAPDAASWGPNRLDVFIRGTDGALWQIAWDGSEWSEWHRLGGQITSDPGAVSWGPNRIDVFARGTDGQMTQIAWDGARWTQWFPQGGRFDAGSSPDAATAGANRLEVFARGTDGALWRKSWDGSRWVEWARLGGTLTSDPGAVAVRAARARFRVTLNGFTVNRETYDHLLEVDGKRDEVYVVRHVWVIDGRRNLLSKQSGHSRVLGDVNRDDWRTTRVRAGSASDLGGLRTGDSFPSREPWRRSREPQRDTLPMLLWEGELVEGEDAAVIMPTVWEWDGDAGLLRTWEGQMLGDTISYISELAARFERNAGGEFQRPVLTGAGYALRRSVTYRNADLFQEAGDRPIGFNVGVIAHRPDGSPYMAALSFTPKVLVLTHAAAQEAVRASDNDKGPGVFEIRYEENHRDYGFPGIYTLYLQVERLP